MRLVKTHHFFVHLGAPRIGSLHALVFFLNGLDLRLKCRHLLHRGHLLVAHREQHKINDEGKNNDSHPVVAQVAMDKLKAQRKRPDQYRKDSVIDQLG